jgi:cholesterol oxidase
MPSLSTPIGELRSRYGAIVVGSGYGGAIAAYRMARKAAADGARGKSAFSVCLLERGLEILSGDYPSSLASALGQVQADTRFGHIGRRTGLFDVRINPDISVLVGCGLGGTSLINGGVMLPPLPDVFADKRWPADLKSPHALEEEFKVVRFALGAHPVPGEVSLDKVTRLFQAAHPDDPAAAKKGERPPIAVSFRTGVNRFGVQQQRCVLCGDCLTGCNHSAKNTLVMNYLPRAASAGAAIFCGVDVRAIENGNGLWRLHVRILDRASRRFGSPELTISARAVFLAAGTLGSTEILLRSRDRYGLSVSPELGRRFSGNGDAIAFGYNAQDPVNGVGYGEHVPRDASVGPLIAGMIDERSEKSGGIMIQEGAIPGVLSPVLRFAAPVMARVTHIPSDIRFDFLFKHLWCELDSLIRGARHGALRRTQTFLAMSRDDGRGVMRLARNRIRITWHHAGAQLVFRKITRRLNELTLAMRGRYVINPFWSRLFGRRLVTVHPLGGCCMGDSAKTGVVNSHGEVFDGEHGSNVHTGLYVCDGAIIPLPLGTNPALTIGALAERIALHAAAPMASLMTPEDAPPQMPGRVTRSMPGIRYAERLRGWMRLNGFETRLELILHISAESVEDLIKRPDHKARIVGVACAPDLDADRRRFTVSDGTFNVLVDDPRTVDTKLIAYELKLTSTSGEEFWLRGHKTINLATCRRGTWRAISCVPFEIYDGAAGTPRQVVGGGRARSSVLDAMRMVASMEVIYERRFMQRLRLTLRYWWFFAEAVIQARVWLLSRTPRINPFDRPAPPRSACLRKGRRIEDDKRKNDPRFFLTPYTSAAFDASKAPVILAPGFGMSTYAFLVGKPSITEYLCEKGYQVWLLDYRASGRLQASLEQFTLDDLALEDFPDAIEKVYQATGQQRVHLVMHCVASLTVLMALLKGTLTKDCVRSVVLSQSFAFIDHPWINRLKARFRLPQLLRYLHFRPVLDADYDLLSGWGNRFLDRILRFYPSNERCTNGVCRRLLMMYGEVVRHDQLDRGTHEILYDMFDRANLTTFEHLAKMIACGHIVDKTGKDTYLKDGHGKITVPITLIQGKANGLFRPRGARDTYKWLIECGGFGADNKNKFTLEEIDGHGHLDTFIGQTAPVRAFPKIFDALERWS